MAFASACALFAGVARAGTYEVAICHDPLTGLEAPTGGLEFPTSGLDSFAGVYQGCGGGGYVYAAMGGAVAHVPGDSAAWLFQAPPATTIAAAALYRSFSAGPSAPFRSPIAALDAIGPQAAVTQLDDCTQAFGCSLSGGGPDEELDGGNLVSFDGLSGAVALEGSATCGGGAQSCAAEGGAVCPELGGEPCIAANHLYAMVVTLEDSEPPSAADVSGTLVAPGALSGVVGVSFDATDAGAGVYSDSISVDGVTRASALSGGGCAPLEAPAAGAPMRFAASVPCPLSASRTLALDTLQLADGVHFVSVEVTDAAGNTGVAWSGSVDIVNAPQGGVPAISGTAVAGQTLVAVPGSWSPAPTAYAYEWQRCDGAGAACQPIPGAQAQTYALTSADDRSTLRVVVTASDAEGSASATSGVSAVVLDAGSLPAASAGPGGSGGAATPAGGGRAVARNGRGGCASPRLRATLAAAAVVYGRAVTLRGALRCGERPVAGALLRVVMTASGGRGPARSGRVRTRGDGSFTYFVGPGPSRRIVVSYRELAGQRPPSASAAVTLRVRPRITLEITPTQTTNGHTITFSGQVSGGAEPPGGLPLELEYREGGRWMIYDTVRADPADGRYVYRYTFRRTTQSITYTFRFAIPATGVAGYPFQPAVSAARSVHVDP